MWHSCIKLCKEKLDTYCRQLLTGIYIYVKLIWGFRYKQEYKGNNKKGL